jgi:hypothetical protein
MRVSLRTTDGYGLSEGRPPARSIDEMVPIYRRLLAP